jgi:hypothetical protein
MVSLLVISDICQRMWELLFYDLNALVANKYTFESLGHRPLKQESGWYPGIWHTELQCIFCRILFCCWNVNRALLVNY